MSDTYDCIIVGAGPAGLGAALYTARDRMKTLILEKFMPGGQIINTDRIENYPGIERIDGAGLIMQMQKQVENFGAEIKTGCEVSGLEKLQDGNIAVYCDEDKYTARTVILTPGSDYRKLGVPGEEEFRNAGAGVSYCGTCDAPFYKGREVVAVGGGNTAVEETLHLTKFAQKVTMLHRRDEFRAAKILIEELLEKANEPNSNLIIKYSTVATAIEGQGKVQSAKLKNVKTGQEEDYPCDGVFIFIGMVPNTGFLKGFVELTDRGFIKCDCAYLRTSVPGVFVAGDCRIGAAMQLATAVGDGVVAAMMLKQYFRDPAWWNEPVSDLLQPGGW
ncbi:MAG: FAD-dependent oxidoreductase [Planctomycetes bacterium]|nr:FAD-dependent oxidoreductase [Planctomycetota bacterium]MCH8118373.1 FAD-dependent oxidoreductase [Planctomycetota bacterium]